MNTLTKTDLEDMALILEDLQKRLPKLKRGERVDLAARLRTVASRATAIIDEVKGEIKEQRAGQEGYVNGEVFRARLQIVPTERLDQKLLKEDDPKVYARYLKASQDQRITFGAR